MVKKRYIIALLALAAILLCGCSMSTVTDLYCLPRRSEEYTNLQSVMKNAMSGSDYSAPLNGDNQQTVQKADLNGDGEPEYILFAKSRGNAEKPLQIFVFSGDGETYTLLDTIESTGYAFDQVEYIQMDGRSGVEIVVGRQVSDQVVRSVSVYTMVNDQIEQVVSAKYTKFLTCDLDGNKCRELLVLRPGENEKGVAELYSVNHGILERSEEVKMSEPAENINRIITGKLNDGVPAVYVASSITGSSGIITDVYALIDGQLTNVSFSNESGTSVKTLRNYYVYADDIDGDGVLELPDLVENRVPLTGIDDSKSSYVIRWYAMTSDGSEVDKMYTYHNFEGSWYLRLENAIADRVSLSQAGSSFEFYLWSEDYTDCTKLMTLYVLTGQKREEQAVVDNRFVLYRGDAAIYAASLEVVSADYGMSQQGLIDDFHLIVTDWKTGET